MRATDNLPDRVRSARITKRIVTYRDQDFHFGAEDARRCIHAETKADGTDGRHILIYRRAHDVLHSRQCEGTDHSHLVCLECGVAGCGPIE